MAAAHLLNTQSAASDTAKSIVAAAADGTLTEKRLNTLIDEAAQQQSRANYVGELRARSERLFVNAFHQALADGAADQLIDSLRPAWDGAAEAIGAARALINAESSADQILASAQPSVITAWQGLDEHLAVIGKIAAIASQFGPRLGQFPLIKEFANADGFRLEDRAIFATDGGLEVDSGVFRRPDQGTAHHRGSGCRYGSTPSPRRGNATANGPRPNGSRHTQARKKASSAKTARCMRSPGRPIRSSRK